jgi:hypothetical protein
MFPIKLMIDIEVYQQFNKGRTKGCGRGGGKGDGDGE